LLIGFVVTTSALSWFASGCAGGSSESGAGGGGGEGGDITTTTSNPSSSVATGMGGGGSGSGGSGSGGEGGSSAALLYPLAVGDTWTFDVQNVGLGGACQSGTHASVILSKEIVEGKDAFKLDSFCDPGPPYFLASDVGDKVLINVGAGWHTLTDTPLAEGHMWLYAPSNTTLTWHSEGDVTVPAGTFSDCWTSNGDGASGVFYTTYCRGIGVVRNYRASVNGDGWDAQLTAKSP
jgi:hypothetical protein